MTRRSDGPTAAFVAAVWALAAAGWGGPLTVRFDEPPSPDRGGITRSVVARRLARAPIIDGLVDEWEWKDATRLSGLRVLDGAAGVPATRARVGFYAGYLCVAVECDEPDPARRTGPAADERDAPVWEGNAVVVLLDPTLRRDDVSAIAVAPSGAVADYRVSNAARDPTWNIECIAAASATPTGWAAEARVARAVLDNPENDIIGFNIVRLRPGDANAPFSWNPTAGDFERGVALGSLSFQRQVCTIESVELGWPHVGKNRFRVWLRNETPAERAVQCGLATRPEAGETDTSRYRIRLPPGRATAVALEHNLRAGGRTDLAFAVVDEETGQTAARFTRPGLNVLPGRLLLTVKTPADPDVREWAFGIYVPSAEAPALKLAVLLYRTEGAAAIERFTAESLPSRSGVVRVATGDLAPGEYRLEARLMKGGELLEREEEAFRK